jgi:hypothetical protein
MAASPPLKTIKAKIFSIITYIQIVCIGHFGVVDSCCSRLQQIGRASCPPGKEVMVSLEGDRCDVFAK